MWWRRVDVSVRHAGARMISVLPRYIALPTGSSASTVADPVAGDPASTVHIGWMSILLDVHRHPFDPGDGREDPFELAVDLSFSLARSAAAAAAGVSVLTNAPQHPDWYADAESITDVLTSVRACTAYPGCAAAPSLRSMVQRRYHEPAAHAVHGGLTVIVSTAADAATVLSPLADQIGSPAGELVLPRAGSPRTAAAHRGPLRVLEVSSLDDAAQTWADSWSMLSYVGPRQSSRSTDR
jgi:hypothetical protein